MEVTITTNEVLGRQLAGTVKMDDDTISVSLNVTTSGNSKISRLEAIFKKSNASYGTLTYEGGRIRINDAQSSDNLLYISQNAQSIIDAVTKLL